MKNMRKRPMTTGELFDAICKILKEKGKLPDILDYGLATHNPVPIKNYEYGLLLDIPCMNVHFFYIAKVFAYCRWEDI